MDLRNKIAESPMSRRQWFVVALAVLLNMLDGFDVLALAFTAKSIKTEMGLSDTQIGTLMSAGLFGMTAGSLLLGPLADKFGRRPLLLLSTALSALGMLMTYFAQSTEMIAISRVITGIGVGGILPCTNVIVSEYANKKWRGLAIAIYAAGFGAGAMLGGMSAVMLQAEYGWRAVFMTGAVATGLALLVIYIWLPESVDFLMSKRPANAKARLNQIAAKIGLAGDWDLPDNNTQNTQKKASFLRLFEADNIRTTLLIWVAFVCVMASFYFISSWTPALLENAGMAKEKSQTVGMGISIGGTIGSLAFGFLVSRWDSRKVLLAFTVLSALAVCVFVPATSVLSLAFALAVLLGALINACIAGLYTINPTLYATDFRSTGVSMAIGVGRLGSIISPLAVGILLDAGWQKNQLYFGAAMIMLFATAAIAFLQTKNHIQH